MPLNVPTQEGAAGPICTYELVPLPNITRDGTNVFQIYLAGAQTVMVENRSEAPLMIQLFPQGSQAGIPIVRFIDPSKDITFAWDAPLNSIVLSNLSFPAVPIFGNTLYPTQANLQNRTKVGFVLVSGSSMQLSYGGGENAPVAGGETFTAGMAQSALGNGIAAANTTTTLNVPLTADINGVVIMLSNSVNVSLLTVTGHVTGVPVYGQPPPYAAEIAIPVNSAFDTSIDVAITMPAAQTCSFWVVGRRDSLLSALVALDLPPATVNAAIAGNVPVINGTGTTLGTTLAQKPLATFTAAANGTTTQNVPVGVDVNGLLIVMENSANVTTLAVTGHTTSTPLYAQGGPYADMAAVPVTSAYDTSVDVAVTMPVGQTCVCYVIGRRDSFLTAVAQLDQVPLTVSQQGNVSVVNPPGGVLGTQLAQRALATFTAAANGTTTQNVLVGTDVNGVLLLLSNSANITSLTVTGHITGIPLYAQPGPYGDMAAVPVSSAYDTSIDIAVQMPIGQTCLVYVIGRRDSFLQAIAAMDQGIITTNTSISGNVPIINAIGNTLGVGHNQTQLLNVTVPANGTSNYTITPSIDHASLVIGVSNTNNITDIWVTGNQTGLSYQYQIPPFDSVFAFPIMPASDTTYNVRVRMPAAQTTTLVIAGRRDAVAQKVSNPGNMPLTVAPASGSQLTSLPGASATRTTTSKASPTFPFTFTLGTAFTTPISIFGVFAAARLQINPLGGNAEGWVMVLQLKGVTSGKTIDVGAMGTTLHSTASAGNDRSADVLNLIFPFPLDAVNIFPSDATLQFQALSDHTAANFVNFYASVLTS